MKKALPLLLLLLFTLPTTTPLFATRKKADGYNPVINYEINVKKFLFFPHFTAVAPATS